MTGGKSGIGPGLIAYVYCLLLIACRFLKIPGCDDQASFALLIVSGWHARAAHEREASSTASTARAVGRAGAVTARGDSPSAIYYNVAGIGRMEPGTHLELDLNLVRRELVFQRTGDMCFASRDGFRVNRWNSDGDCFESLSFPEVNDQAGVYPAPFFALVTDLGLDSDWRFAFGAFGPAAIGRADFPTQSWMENLDGDRIPIPGPQRYDILYMDILFVWPTLAASWRITDDLAVGLGFQSGVVNINFQSMAIAAPGSSVVNDLRANIDAWDWFVPAGLVGVWYRPTPWFEMAWSMRVSDEIRATGDLVTISNPYGVLDQDPVSSDEWDFNEASGERAPTASLSFAWPLINTRAGFRFVWPKDGGGDVVGGDLDPDVASRLARMMPHEREWLDVELDVAYEMNSSVETFEVKIDGLVPTGYGLPPIPVLPAGDPPGVMSVDHNWKDTWALRLGGDVNLLDSALSLRWGLSYESSSVPEEWTRIDYAQWETFGVSGGVTVRLPWYGVDLTAGYLHLFMPDRTVTNGQARKLSAFPTDPADPEMIINNGSYRTSMDIFSVGIQATF